MTDDPDSEEINDPRTLTVPGVVRSLTLRPERGGPGHVAFFEIHSDSGGVMPAIAFPDVVKTIRDRLKEGERGRFAGSFVEEESDDDDETSWRLFVTSAAPE